MKNEQKLSKEQKFSKFQRDFENQRGDTIRTLVFVIVLETIMLIIVSNDLTDYICYGIVFYLVGLAVIQPALANMNTRKLEKRLRTKFAEEKRHVSEIEGAHFSISTMGFDYLGPELREVARYLLSSKDKTPKEIIAMRRDELENLEVKLRVYSESPERNFWQYFVSWKWLKKTPLNTKEKIVSHFAFEEHWNELPEYAGYVPEQYHSWQSFKDEFFSSGKYGPENPLPVNIKKDNTVIVVNVYGFKVPDAPQVVRLVALCKIITTKEFVAIAW